MADISQINLPNDNNSPYDIKDASVPHSSLPAQSGGTDLSLVTTGEKYLWGQGGSSSLANLSDVTITTATLSTGQTIIYDAENNVWVNGAPIISSLDGNVILAGTVTSGAIAPEYTNSLTDLINTTAQSIISAYTLADSTLSNNLQEMFTTEITNTVAIIDGDISDLQEQIDNINLTIDTQSISGINKVANSSGLNGLVSWTYGGTVEALQDSTAQDHTVSGSMFKIDGTAGNASDISQVVRVMIGQLYTISFKAYRTTSEQCTVQIIGAERTITVIDETSPSNWEEFNTSFTASGDSITILASTEGSSFYIADFVLIEGGIKSNWLPAPYEIYTPNVTVDKSGIKVNNLSSGNQTVINTDEFSVYYNNSKVFEVKQNITAMSVATVDEEISIGKGKFVAVSEGVNFVLLD